MANGFYKTNHFSVMPYRSEGFENEVILPDLPYLNIPRYWDQVVKTEIVTSPEIEVKADEKLFSQVEKLLTEQEFEMPLFAEVEKIWNKHQEEILDELYRLMPSKAEWIKKLEIWPTNFGTARSSNKVVGRGVIQIWLREMRISSLAKAVIIALTRQDVYEGLRGTWQESQAVVDWIMGYSSLGEIISQIEPDGLGASTLSKSRSMQSAKLIEESNRFLTKIGAPIVDFGLVRNMDTSVLTEKERLIWDLLISKAPGLVSMDEIGDALSGGRIEEFSLYAVNKMIQRLRDKMEAAGISGSFIQTKRGGGYLMAI